MPDYDNVYFGVYKTFTRAYMQLCEGRFSEVDVAAEIERKFRELLKRFGNPAICMLIDGANSVARAISSGEAIDEAREFRRIDRLARDCEGNRDFASIAVDAFKACVRDNRLAGFESLVHETVIHKFLWDVLDAYFFERHQLGRHHNDISSEYFETRLAAARANLESYVDYIVAQIVKCENADTLRKLSKKRANSPDFSQMDIAL